MKRVYTFGDGKAEGNAEMRNLLGGKGANLAEMNLLGMPVPPGFTITTEVCNEYTQYGRDEVVSRIKAEVEAAIAHVEELTGKKFNDPANPLLVSVRSGARASMPGMMDTILNLGLNETVVNTIATKSNNPRWAWDCYRRFIQMFSDVVMEVGKKYFEKLIDDMKAQKGIEYDVDLTADDLKELAYQFKAEYKKQLGKDFPDDPKEQLFEAVKAVFRSWDNPRANIYRMDHDIPYSWGTAVNVQMMAFGNMGDNCGTGVAFTRNPATGEKGLMGEFLTNAQGEDVVAGVRTPMPIAKMAEIFPEVYEQFLKVCEILEKVVCDKVDGTGKNAYVAGYRIGGKTGTSTDTVKEAGGVKKYIVSFLGVAPMDDPQIAILVLLDNPTSETVYVSGGNMGAPTVGNIMADVLPYLGVEAVYTDEEAANMDRSVPQVTGLSVGEAQALLSSQGLGFRVIGEGGEVTMQLPSVNTVVAANSEILLYAGSEPSESLEEMPDLAGLTYSVARQRLGYYGLFIKNGSNKLDDSQFVVVSRQSIEPGTEVEHGTVVEVTLVDMDSSVYGQY